MSSPMLGLIFLLAFAISQAIRDAFFGSVLQSVSFFVIAILAFGSSTLLFGAWALVRQPNQVRSLVGFRDLFTWLNITTAAAWIGYFFALQNLEPAIVTTLYTGVGPLAVVALAALGVPIAGTVALGSAERAANWSVFASLLATGAVAVLGRSGMPEPSVGLRVIAVLCATSGGTVIAVSHMIARRLGDLGVGSGALLGLRGLLTLIIAFILDLSFGQPSARPSYDDLPLLAFAAFGLIVIPGFFLQLGIARASPLTVNVMRTLGPVFVFAVQQVDGRIRFSGATLMCIIAFVCFTSLSSALRGWTEARRN